MVKLKRLKIGKYRHVAPGTELTFSDGFNVLLGQNATGKTTLLELIAMVLRSDVESLRREELDLEYDVTFGEVTVHAKVLNSRKESGARSDERSPANMLGFGRRDGSLTFEYDITVAAKGQQARFVGNEGEALLKRPKEADGVVSFGGFGLTTELFWASSDGSDDWAAPIQACTSLGSLQRFDESLDWFDSLLALGERVRRAGTSVYRGPFSELSPELFDALRKRIIESPPRAVQIPESELRFLATSVARFDLMSAELRLDLVGHEPAAENGFDEWTFGKPSFYFIDHDGSGFTEDRLSFGQKRLLAFLYYLSCNEQICIADELVNGLHHEWIAACVEDIGQRQAFLASQNPLLLDHLQFASAEEASRCFIRCTRERHDKNATVRSENMSPDDASAFFRAYKAGLQHVGEILRTQGLW